MSERISNNIWCKFAATLLDLVREMEQLLNDYRRLLTVQNDGHWLEHKSSDELI